MFQINAKKKRRFVITKLMINFAKCVKKKHLSEASYINLVFPTGNLSSLIRIFT